ncbi:MAG: hypothetical protein RJA34_1197 [Pseudomonadota bacterium]|jgi:sugar phosphate isomerase/epimerase
MRLGIFAKTFPGSRPAEVFLQVREAGFREVQYNLACSGLSSMPLEISSQALDEIVLASKAHGLALAAVSGTYNMIHPDVAVRKDGHARLEVLAAACRNMGTNLITLCTGTRDAQDQWKEHPDNNSPEAWADLLQAMQTAIDIAEKHEVYLGIEPELANVVNSAAKARKLIDTLQSDRIKIILDPANLFEVATLAEQRDTVTSAIALLADRIIMGHAKDRYADGRFATAGQGVLDYPHYLSQLKANGFSGSLVAHGLPASEAAGVSAFLRETCGKLGIQIEETPA